MSKGRIVKSGMGGFLNPPTHPEHDYSVDCGHDGCMSLSAAIDAEWLDANVRLEASRKLEDWKAHALPLDTPSVREWVLQVLGYMKNCYRNPAEEGAAQWYGSNVVIDRLRNALDYIADHAGVHFIRQYYPHYQPTAEDFKNAYWGTKP